MREAFFWFCVVSAVLIFLTLAICQPTEARPPSFRDTVSDSLPV